MRAGDAADDGESKARALSLLRASTEPLEDTRLVGRSDAIAGVAYPEPKRLRIDR